jgi:hypothetical protein
MITEADIHIEDDVAYEDAEFENQREYERADWLISHRPLLPF